MAHQAIIPAGSAPPLAPYSPGVRVGNTVYVSGVLAMESIKSVVEAAGGSMSDIAFNQIFLADLAGYGAMNEVYAEYFPSNPPARYCIKAELVKPEFLVEISSTAHVG
jgi:aminoacrylate peracid reductase